MCGIFFSNFSDNNHFENFQKLSHRGPDSTTIKIQDNYFYGFHRLAIIHPNSDYNQPFTKNNIVLLCNGEIYNYKLLLRKYFVNLTEEHLKSDCEIILYLYFLFDRNFKRVVEELDGEFAIILHDKDKNVVYSARDFMGIRPLYYIFNEKVLTIASEIKAISQDNVKHILPRKIYSFNLLEKNHESYLYWDASDNLGCINFRRDIILDTIYNYLHRSVKLRVHSDRPIGCLLSGGLDSSIIVSLVSKLYPIEKIQCFTIGSENSTDVKYAKIVANYLKVPLTIVPFDYQQGFNEIENVVKCLETYDITTIRASTPQYLLAKYISKNTDIKVILSGEGSDELFSGYLYSRLAPSEEELYKDGVRLLNELYLFDCLRTDRTMAYWGLEVRVPFLNKKLVDYVLCLDPKYRMCNEYPEKMLLRDVALKNELLPEEIILRRKEAFSDAVSDDITKDSWINYIKQKCLDLSKVEKDYYKELFDKHYPNKNDVFSHYWLPNWTNEKDPSATLLSIY